jgi:hypothetical protein
MTNRTVEKEHPHALLILTNCFIRVVSFAIQPPTRFTAVKRANCKKVLPTPHPSMRSIMLHLAIKAYNDCLSCRASQLYPALHFLEKRWWLFTHQNFTKTVNNMFICNSLEVCICIYSNGFNFTKNTLGSFTLLYLPKKKRHI